MQPISLVLDTFMARAAVGEPLAHGFDRVRRSLVDPLLAANGDLRAWFELSPGYILGRPTLPADESSWGRIAELVGRGDAAYCSVEIRGDSRSAGYFHFGVRLGHELVADVPHTVTMHAHPTMFAAVPGLRLTHEIATLTRELARRCKASTGYIACHLALSKDAEEQRGGDATNGAQPDLRSHLRGCYWGNFMSAGHLEALGGREHVLAACPADVVENLGDDEHELVFVGLSGNPCDDHGQAIIDLERFLQPALPQRDEEPVAATLEAL
jgi:hypothetical protein